MIAVLYAISFALALMFHGVRTVADASVTCQRYKVSFVFLWREHIVIVNSLSLFHTKD